LKIVFHLSIIATFKDFQKSAINNRYPSLKERTGEAIFIQKSINLKQGAIKDEVINRPNLF
jgi:hypothetical protein